MGPWLTTWRQNWLGNWLIGTRAFVESDIVCHIECHKFNVKLLVVKQLWLIFRSSRVFWLTRNHPASFDEPYVRKRDVINHWIDPIVWVESRDSPQQGIFLFHGLWFELTRFSCLFLSRTCSRFPNAIGGIGPSDIGAGERASLDPHSSFGGAGEDNPATSFMAYSKTWRRPSPRNGQNIALRQKEMMEKGIPATELVSNRHDVAHTWLRTIQRVISDLAKCFASLLLFAFLWYDFEILWN